MRTAEQIEFVTRWANTLRSGEYKQGKNRLRKADDTFCCLGVVADMQNVSCTKCDDEFAYTFDDNRAAIGGYASILPEFYFQDLTGFTWEQAEIAELNDKGKTFAEIADILDRSNTFENTDELRV